MASVCSARVARPRGPCNDPPMYGTRARRTALLHVRRSEHTASGECRGGYPGPTGSPGLACRRRCLTLGQICRATTRPRRTSMHAQALRRFLLPLRRRRVCSLRPVSVHRGWHSWRMHLWGRMTAYWARRLHLRGAHALARVPPVLTGFAPYAARSTRGTWLLVASVRHFGPNMPLQGAYGRAQVRWALPRPPVSARTPRRECRGRGRRSRKHLGLTWTHRGLLSLRSAFGSVPCAHA